MRNKGGHCESCGGYGLNSICCDYCGTLLVELPKTFDEKNHFFNQYVLPNLKLIDDSNKKPRGYKPVEKRLIIRAYFNIIIDHPEYFDYLLNQFPEEDLKYNIRTMRDFVPKDTIQTNPPNKRVRK
jgi:rRNA maturation protein Nop10